MPGRGQPNMKASRGHAGKFPIIFFFTVKTSDLVCKHANMQSSSVFRGKAWGEAKFDVFFLM